MATRDNRTLDQQDDQKQATRIKNVTTATGGSQEQEEDETEAAISLDHRLKLGPKKKLLVIPLRGIFVHRAHRWYPENIPRNTRPDFRYGNLLIYVRPYCVDFLRFCFERFHVGLWSCFKEQNMQGILTMVMGDLKNKLAFTWDQEHCTDSGFMCPYKQDKPLFFKELSHLWDKMYPNLLWSDEEYSASNTLLITYPEKALLNPPNTAIFPPSYDPENKKDDLLGLKGELRVFLNGLVEAEDVQTYVERNPIGEPAITPLPDWDYYCKIICSFNKKRNGDQVKII
ncbi:uncharacterized protein LOC143619485 [Bidens hawaiensis]|uniref:uncharacterized protein LOC143619485 n=1 Tax=Bidens hawaiensis TaxID=980011 RepID=UPI00404AF77A